MLKQDLFAVRDELASIIEEKRVQTNKKVVITALFGNYDELKTPFYVTSGWDHVCFTDNPNLESSFWRIIHLSEYELKNLGVRHVANPRLHAKFYKMLPWAALPGYEESLWVDAAFSIIGNVDEYVDTYSKSSDMLCVIHPFRDCIYDEAVACIEAKLDSPEIIQRQIEKYHFENFPEHNGLIAAGVLYRKHTEQVKRLCEFWYIETMNGSCRDQLSFNYCSWKLDFFYDVCDLNCWDNRFFKFYPHKA